MGGGGSRMLHGHDKTALCISAPINQLFQVHSNLMQRQHKNKHDRLIKKSQGGEQTLKMSELSVLVSLHYIYMNLEQMNYILSLLFGSTIYSWVLSLFL